MSQLHLVLLIHAHQPVGNFDDVLAEAYAHSYLPFLEMLQRHPAVRLGMHYSGPLLEWIEARHPEFFDRLRLLAGRGQIELVGGGFYEPILIAIPPEDRLEQIRRMADYLESKLGTRPSGAWLAERVWEPQLPSSLAAAGMDYTLVDDIHFLASGFTPEQLYGYYVAEDLGTTVKVFPGLKELRYLIPFREVRQCLDFLRGAAGRNHGGCAVMGDDCEKFGVWPGTYEHCYRNGWLEKFFTALEENSGWLRTTPPGEYIATHPALGRADLPAASYTEMTEWALPTPTRQRFHALQQEFAGREDVLAFLRGGFWRAFFSKYPEANLLHKKMLHVSAKVRALAATTRRGLPFRRALDDATTHLLRAQCNDAYWHGIFGGLYAPHLRTAAWRELIRAEKLADGTQHGRATYAELSRLDFDADGQEEIYLVSETFAALAKPSDGATLAALDFRPSDATLINSIQRRPEAYHARLRQAGNRNAQAVASIHEQTRVKEPGLERRLRYDRWARHAFRLLLFAPWKTCEDYEGAQLEESPVFAAAAYSVAGAAETRLEFLCEGPLAGADSPVLRASKTLLFAPSAGGVELACELTLSHVSGEPLRLRAGLEVVLNFLAPNEPDRYFEFAESRQPLQWGGIVSGPGLRVVDGWQNVAASLEASEAGEFWVAPIESISESEEGFERIYQGSQILAVWPLELAAGGEWRRRLVLRLSAAR